MPSIHVICSGSKGNCYILDCCGEKLVIELGCSHDDILKAVGYDLSSVPGCIVSHIHSDHFNPSTAAYMNRAGIPIYGNAHLSEMWNFVRTICLGTSESIGGYRVQPIGLFHSVDNYGYLIKHESIGKLVFATDTKSFPYRMKDVSHWMIEANWDEETVLERKMAGDDIRSNYKDHLSIGSCVEALSRNMCPKTRTVTLIHLSMDNSNAPLYRSMVNDELSMECCEIAEKGRTIELDAYGF